MIRVTSQTPKFVDELPEIESRPDFAALAWCLTEDSRTTDSGHFGVVLVVKG